MDVRYINPFLVAVKELLTTMIGLPFESETPVLNGTRSAAFDISGIIGLSGPITGCVVISLPERLAIRMASGLLGDTLDSFDDDAIDAFGEITNMIVGNAKSNFPEDGCTISAPSVVMGRHEVAVPSSVPVITIPCDIGGDPLHIDVAFQKRDPA